MTGRKLADMGADVVKLLDFSRVKSDKRTARHALVGGTRLSPVLDRNKRNIYLDFEDEQDRATIHRLCDVADVIVEGSRPGAFTARTGVDFHELRARRPEVVIASVSGFGQTGPLASLAAQGTNLEALPGILPLEQVDGHWDYAESANCTFTIELGMLHAVSGILAALYSVQVSGGGAWVDASCWDGGIEVNRRSLSIALAGEPDRTFASSARTRPSTGPTTGGRMCS
jgi:alpha-methylacyl-CoA racemase